MKANNTATTAAQQVQAERKKKRRKARVTARNIWFANKLDRVIAELRVLRMNNKSLELTVKQLKEQLGEEETDEQGS